MANAIPLAELSAQLSNFVLQQKPPAWLVNELQDKLVILYCKIHHNKLRKLQFNKRHNNLHLYLHLFNNKDNS